jgi:SAM-dependent methyltransferase
MSVIITAMNHFLNPSKICAFSERFLAAGSKFLLQRKYGIFIEPSKGLVLDIGFGPRLCTPMPDGVIIGADINLKCATEDGLIDKSQKTSKHREYRWESHPRVVCLPGNLPFRDSSFDETRSSSFLHHLPPDSALRVIKEMLRCTRPPGKVIIFDGVWPRNPVYRPLAWLIRRYDRGQWVRTEQQLLDLAKRAYDGNWQHKRFTYTLSGLEGMLLTIERPNIPALRIDDSLLESDSLYAA